MCTPMVAIADSKQPSDKTDMSDHTKESTEEQHTLVPATDSDEYICRDEKERTREILTDSGSHEKSPENLFSEHKKSLMKFYNKFSMQSQLMNYLKYVGIK